MKVVKYSADGMKSVLIEDITMSEFWKLFQKHKKRCEAQMVERTKDHEEMCELYRSHHRNYTGSIALVEAYRTGGNSYEVTDEALASGCTQYVARPDNWPETNGEPD